MTSKLVEIPNDVKFIYFDVGNVFFTFSQGIEDLSKKFGINYKECEDFWKKYDGSICKGSTSPQNFWNLARTKFRYTGQDIDFVDFWLSHFNKIKKGHELAKKLAKDFRLGLITNIYPGVFEKVSQNGLLPNLRWESVVLSCNYGLVKPERELFDIAQAKCGFKSNEILLIDDIYKNCEKAKEFGWESLVFEKN